MATAGPISSSSTAATGRRARAARCPRCIGTTRARASRISRPAAGSTLSPMAWAPPRATTTTTAAPTSTSPHSTATACTTTRAPGSSATCRRRRASPTPASARARRGSITTRTAGSISSSPITCSGRRRPICGARWTAPRNPYCTPESYPGTASKLYRNLGGGRFDDVSRTAGVADPTSKSLGISILDFDSDGWPDLFVANDTQPNKLYRNNRNGTFTDVGAAVRRRLQRGRRRERRDGRRRRRLRSIGTAAPARRQLLQPDARSLPQRGQRPVRGRSAAIDRRPRVAADCSRSASSSSTTTSTAGPTSSPPTATSKKRSGACSRRCSTGSRRCSSAISDPTPPRKVRVAGPRVAAFRRCERAVGKDFTRPIVARGAAYADYDRDGDLDVALTTNHGPAYLYRNDGGNRNNWIAVQHSRRRSRTATALAPSSA